MNGVSSQQRLHNHHLSLTSSAASGAASGAAASASRRAAARAASICARRRASWPVTCGEGGEGGGEGCERGSALATLSSRRYLYLIWTNSWLYLGCLSAAASSRVLRKAGCFITAGEETACT